METEIGVPLPTRTTRRVQLTAAGRALLDETRGSITQLERAANLAQRVGRSEIARLRIGHSDSAAVELLQRALTPLVADYPAIALTVLEQPTADLVTNLEHHNLDLALVRPPLHHPGLDEEHLLDEPLIVLLPPKHPLTAAKTVSVADLIRYPIILPPRSVSPGAHDRLVATYHDHGGGQPAMTQEAASFNSFLILITAGCGVALYPSYALRHLRPSGIQTRALNQKVPPLPVHAAWNKSSDNPLVYQLRQHLQQAARQLQRRK